MRWVWLVLAMALSGVLLEAALPPVGWSVLGWFCFVPTLVACRGLGFAAGFGSGLGSTLIAAQLARQGVWIRPSLVDSDPGWIYAGFVLFGLPVAVLHGLVGEAKNRPRAAAWTMASLAVLLEAALLIYLPAHLALTQSRSAALLALTSVTGIWGVSWVLWMSNFTLSALLENRSFKPVPGILALGCLLSWTLPKPPASKSGVLVRVVQSPLDDTEFMKNQVTELKQAALVVWPEAAGVGFVVNGDTTPLDQLVPPSSGTLLATSYDDRHEPLPHNTMRVFGASRTTTYNKRKLFGGERNSHTPGSEAAVIKVSGLRLGMNVCFDSCFPSVMRDTVALGADILLLPTLDPITPNGVCQAIHAAYTPFRAVELGRPILRADSTAYSLIVDESGRPVAEAPSGWQGSLDAFVQSRPRETIARVIGDGFLIPCAIAVVWPLLKKRPQKPRPEPETKQG